MAITPLPTPPSRDDPTNFATRADAFLGALPDFATEANALQTDVNAKQVTASNAATTATTQAGIATTKAAEALASQLIASASATEAAELTESYQGALAADPTLDKDGNALAAGDWYINTVSGFLRAYNGTAWVQGISALAGVSSLNGQSGDLSLKTVNSTSLLGAGDVAVQPTLVSGTNIKTLGGASLLGGGDIALSSGAMVFLGSVSASGASTVDINGYFTSAYDNYIIIANGMSQTGVQLLWRALIGGSAQTDANYSFGTANGATSGRFWDFGLVPENLNFQINIPRPLATAYKVVKGEVLAMEGTATPINIISISGYGGSTSAWSGIRLFGNSGTVTGTFRVYGIANS